MDDAPLLKKKRIKAKGNLIFCTDSYSKEDVLFLIQILQSKFNLTPSLSPRDHVCEPGLR